MGPRGNHGSRALRSSLAFPLSSAAAADNIFWGWSMLLSSPKVQESWGLSIHSPLAIWLVTLSSYNWLFECPWQSMASWIRVTNADNCPHSSCRLCSGCPRDGSFKIHQMHVWSGNKIKLFLSTVSPKKLWFFFNQVISKFSEKVLKNSVQRSHFEPDTFCFQKQQYFFQQIVLWWGDLIPSTW